MPVWYFLLWLDWEQVTSSYEAYDREYIPRVSCQKGPICHALAWRVGTFWRDTLDMQYKTQQRVDHMYIR